MGRLLKFGRGRSTLVYVLCVGIAVALAVFFFFVPARVGQHMNALYVSPPYVADAAALQLHDSLLTADLHADTLLWERDPAVRGSYGHIDLPRLLQAHHGLQVFSAVTKTPRRLNFEYNDADSDNITPLVVAQRWPWRTWSSLMERARFQAARLRALALDSGDRFIVIEYAQDLSKYLELRADSNSVTAGVLAIEGLHAIEGDEDNLRRLYEAGFRMMGLAHFFDNEIGGSVHGVAKGGLTPFGTKVLKEMERLGIIVDLAHASPRLIEDVLAVAKKPVVVSHTGVKGTCDRTRNLGDDQLRAIAKNGGLIGIAFFSEAICGNDVDAIANAITYTTKLIGVEHVAIGSDFDGAVSTPFDVTGLPLLTDALMRAGLSGSDIAAVMGGNTLALLKRALPKR